MHLHWHRNDLRIHDNRGVNHGDRETAGVFVLDPSVLEHSNSARTKFLLESLRDLDREYRERGGELTVVRGRSMESIPEIAERVDATVVTWSESYTPLGRERDREVTEKLERGGVEVESYNDSYLHRPTEIYTNKGTPYQVFSYYYKKWRDREKHEAVEPEVELTEIGSVETSDMEVVEDLSDFERDQPDSNPQKGGREAGVGLMNEFLEDDVFSYIDSRELPAESGTSRLSPHLHFGTVGIRELWSAVKKAETEAGSEEEKESVREYESQLAWRDFYNQVLYHNPGVVTENYRDIEVEWRNDPREIEAWKQGETGYPLVDAGMRQLGKEGYMHNRVRMVVASFLTKDLLVDWRIGYRWFRDKLVDHDTANDNGGWQWAASTGTDSQPYFRVFNPQSQLEKHDPECRYVKRYVEELSDVSPEKIKGWIELSDDERNEIAPGYHPIVNHGERRKEAISVFKEAKEREN